jgi:hypothetical protein
VEDAVEGLLEPGLAVALSGQALVVEPPVELHLAVATEQHQRRRRARAQRRRQAPAGVLPHRHRHATTGRHPRDVLERVVGVAVDAHHADAAVGPGLRQRLDARLVAPHARALRRPEDEHRRAVRGKQRSDGGDAAIGVRERQRGDGGR